MLNRLLGFSCLLWCCLANAITIAVFTTQHYPIDVTKISETNVPIYQLDQLNNGLAAINQQLQSVSREQAKVVIRQALQQEKENVRQAIKGLIQAQTLGIQYLPAIVLDGNTVIYGQTQLKQAMWEYQQWLVH